MLRNWRYHETDGWDPSKWCHSPVKQWSLRRERGAGGPRRSPGASTTKNTQLRARLQTLQPQQCIRGLTLPAKTHSTLCSQIPSGATVNQPRAPDAHGSVRACASYCFLDFMVTESAPKPGHLCC